MKKSSHTLLRDCERVPYVLKGLRSPTIIEPGIPVRVNDEPVGRFQGLEVFEKVGDHSGHPQTIADLVCNGYFRLTCQKANGTSATFGTSVLGTISVRTVDETLHFVPTAKSADVTIGGIHRLLVQLDAKHGSFGELSSTRCYAADAGIHETSMQLAVSFVAKEPVEFSRTRIGYDRFRLCTISSMFSAPTLYDGNVIELTTVEGVMVLPVDQFIQRPLYLFSEAVACHEFALVKTHGSQGKVATPGSPDSPSIRVRVVESSVPISELGVQAYLAESTDVNDDSLTVWLEWIQCPNSLEAGYEIRATLEVTSFLEPSLSCRAADASGSIRTDPVSAALGLPAYASHRNPHSPDLRRLARY